MTTTGMPRVLVPAIRMCEIGGVTVALHTVEFWPDRVYVTVIGLPNDVTRRLERAYEEQLDGGRPGPMPGSLILGQVTCRLSDDVGTAYEMRYGGTVGSGTEWIARWVFYPAVPPTATELVVTAPSGPVVVDLL